MNELMWRNLNSINVDWFGVRAGGGEIPDAGFQIPGPDVGLHAGLVPAVAEGGAGGRSPSLAQGFPAAQSDEHVQHGRNGAGIHPGECRWHVQRIFQQVHVLFLLHKKRFYFFILRILKDFWIFFLF